MTKDMEYTIVWEMAFSDIFTSCVKIDGDLDEEKIIDALEMENWERKDISIVAVFPGHHESVWGIAQRNCCAENAA